MTKKYFEKKMDPMVLRVLLEKGIIKEGESFDVVLKRIAINIAKAEDTEEKRKYWADKFYDIMADNYFLPNSPCLKNASREDGKIKAVLSACYTLDIEDSRDSIFDTLKNAVEIQSMGGGTGFNFSKLRQRGSKISSTGGKSSGPISFMDGFSHMLGDIISQSGYRKGANMGILHYSHPDIEEFISIKSKDKNMLKNFNLSVLIDDEFMKKVKQDEVIDIIEPHTGKKIKELSASMLLDMIADNSASSGCPGVLFYDNANRNNMFNIDYYITNPCGEFFAFPYESCILGSINMCKIEEDELDEESKKEIISTAIRFLDNIIEMNYYTLPQIEDITKKYRKIGLNMMGIADVLYMRGLGYNSDEGRKAISKMTKSFHSYSWAASEELSKEKGTFPEIDNSNFKKPVRNGQTTLGAPTGTLSIIAGCSAGIEPVYALSFNNTTSEGTIHIINKIFKNFLKDKRKMKDEILSRIITNNGSIQGLGEFEEKDQKVFVTAMDIHYEDHVKMQATVQEYTDNSISKTINMKNSATAQDVKSAIILAHSLGCKGITVYRDGSKEEQPLQVAKEQNKHDSPPCKPLDRSKVVRGETERISLGQCEGLYMTINRDNGNTIETLINKGHSGNCINSMMECIGRLISLSLRHRILPQEISKELREIKCDNISWDMAEGAEKPTKITSCANACSVALDRFIERNNVGRLEDTQKRKCPKCGEFLFIKDGSCDYCLGCGFSKC